MGDRVLRHGLVVDVDGSPVANAFVTVVWGTAPVPEISRRSLPDGSFGVGLPPGSFRVRAVTSDGRAGEAEVDGETRDAIIIRIEART
jgi:hypothetical protein